MMNIETIERWAEDVLTVCVVSKDGAEHDVWVLLRHLFSAVKMHDNMELEDRQKVAQVIKTAKNMFASKFVLKEKKVRSPRKRKNSPAPPIKEKSPYTPKEEKTSLSPEQNFDGLDEGQMAFWKECSKYIGPKYSEDLVKAFFYYYAQRMRKNGKMAWENEDKWTLHLRLAGWKKRSFAKNDEAAEIRLAKAKAGKQQTAKVNEQQVAIARVRMMEQERREREFAENKAKAVSREEWLAMKAKEPTPDPSRGEGE